MFRVWRDFRFWIFRLDEPIIVFPIYMTQLRLKLLDVGSHCYLSREVRMKTGLAPVNSNAMISHLALDKFCGFVYEGKDLKDKRIASMKSRGVKRSP